MAKHGPYIFLLSTKKEVQEAARLGLETGVFSSEFRILTADSTIRWLAGRGGWNLMTRAAAAASECILLTKISVWQPPSHNIYRNIYSEVV